VDRTMSIMDIVARRPLCVLLYLKLSNLKTYFNELNTLNSITLQSTVFRFS
jgi:hypothetical protein